MTLNQVNTGVFGDEEHDGLVEEAERSSLISESPAEILNFTDKGLKRPKIKLKRRF